MTTSVSKKPIDDTRVHLGDVARCHVVAMDLAGRPLEFSWHGQDVPPSSTAAADPLWPLGESVTVLIALMVMFFLGAGCTMAIYEGLVLR